MTAFRRGRMSFGSTISDVRALTAVEIASRFGTVLVDSPVIAASELRTRFSERALIISIH